MRHGQFTLAVKAISDFFWNNILLFLLCGTGIYFTLRLKLIQVRKFGEECAACSAGLI